MKINALPKGTSASNPGNPSYETTALPLSHRTSLSQCTFVNSKDPTKNIYLHIYMHFKRIQCIHVFSLSYLSPASMSNLKENENRMLIHVS